MTLVCKKPEQVQVWIRCNYELFQFWKNAVDSNTYEGLNKDRQSAIALANYYEGRYDMAIEFRNLLREKLDD